MAKGAALCLDPSTFPLVCVHHKKESSSFPVACEFYFFIVVVVENFVIFTHVYKICICIRCQLFALLENLKH
jgi:hypothetical protein